MIIFYSIHSEFFVAHPHNLTRQLVFEVYQKFFVVLFWFKVSTDHGASWRETELQQLESQQWRNATLVLYISFVFALFSILCFVFCELRD